jgi:hypothetical protein
MRTENEPAQRDQVELPKRPPAARVSRRSRPPPRDDLEPRDHADSDTIALGDRCQRFPGRSAPDGLLALII